MMLSAARTLRYIRITAIVCSSAVVIGSCGDAGTGPAPDAGVSVTISLTNPVTPIVTDGADGPTVTCNFNLTATATGTGGADWMGGVFRVFLGKNKRVPVDSSVLLNNDIWNAFSAPNIRGGSTEQSQWTISAGFPFSAEFVFQYRPQGVTTVQTSSVKFDCSSPVAADAGPPVITSLSTTPESGTFEIETPFTVNYLATAPAGLWQSSIDISGPCAVHQDVTEQLRTSNLHSIVVNLPLTCQVGVPLVVNVSTIDAAEQVGGRSLTTTLSPIDTAPPTLAAPVFQGDYFGGDSVYGNIFAIDNRKVAAVIWEVLPFGTRDSIVPSTRGFADEVRVPLHQDWTGPFQIRYTARDIGGLITSVTSPSSGLRLHPFANLPVRSALMSGVVGHYAIDSRRGMVYLSQPKSNRIQVVSLSTLQVVATIAVPNGPSELDLSAGGDSLIVVMTGRPTLAVVDLRQPTYATTYVPLTALDSSKSQFPVHLRVLANDHAIVVFGQNPALAGGIVDVDLVGGGEHLRADGMANAGAGNILIERSGDASVLIASNSQGPCVRRYAVASDAFGACVAPTPTGESPVIDGNGRNFGPGLVPAVDGAGQHFALGADVYDASLTVAPQVGPIFFGPQTSYGIPLTTLASDGQTLIAVPYNARLIRFSASDGHVLDGMPIPLAPTFAGRLTADGKTLVLVQTNVDTKQTNIAALDLH